MRRCIVISLMILVTISMILIGCGAPAAAPASAPAATPSTTPTNPITLTAISAFPSSSASVQCIAKIGDAVKAKSNGQLLINWVGGPEALAAADQPTALRNGMFDLLASPNDYYQNLVPLITSANVCQYSVEEQQSKGIVDYWNELLKKGLNARFLGWAGYSQYYIFLNKEVKDPKKDFNGLKLRAAPVYIPFLKALGAVPVNISGTEAYSALQTGIVDGAGWVPDNVQTNKAYEVLKYWVDAPFYSTSFAFLTNVDSFNKLPKNLQDILTSSSTEILNKQVVEMNLKQFEYLKGFNDKGMKTITFSPEDKAWFLKLADDSKWADIKALINNQQEYDKVYKLLTKP
jgi:TRAP-type C4-dicarboxylate transport system substrate-binding protein